MEQPGPREMLGSPVSPLSQLHSPAKTPTSATPLRPGYESTVGSTSPGYKDASPSDTEAELSGEPAPKRVPELAIHSERSSINLPSRRQSTTSIEDNNGNNERHSHAPSAAEATARSNLNVETETRRDKPHVMSWMDYDNGTPSPIR